MSYTEIRHREGFPHGGMPHDALLRKLESSGYDGGADLAYDGYARSQIIDWGPDPTFLESDRHRRDPSFSRSVINLRYNGTRGSNPELPRHPELFYGFTGDDPRGSENDPRFDELRGHMTARAAGLTVGMGDNDDQHIAERPWTNQAISYAQKEVFRRIQARTKVFTVSKEGRALGRNVALAPYTANELRAATMDASHVGEGFADYDPATDLLGGGARRLAVLNGEDAPWRHTTGDGDLGVQRYGASRGPGANRIGTGAQGGGRLRGASTDHDWATTALARGTNRAVLGASMALASRSRRTGRSGAHDQTLRPPGEIQDDIGGVAGGAGLTPGSDLGMVAHAALAHTSPTHLSNVGAIVTGLREGTASSRRRIAGQVAADGARVALPNEAAARRGLTPSNTLGRVARQTGMEVASPAAAGLEVHTYKSTPLRQGRNDQTEYAEWRAQLEGLNPGASALPQWRSATQGQYELGASAAETFGQNDVDFGHGGAPVGPKSLRPAADSAEFDDFPLGGM